MKRICIVAGHSGGHILPCITLAKKASTATTHIDIISTKNNIDKKIIKSFEFLHKKLYVPLYKMPTKVHAIPLFMVQFIYAFIRSFIFLITNRPGYIITTGGLIAIPVCLAAKLLMIKVKIYELNVEPGKTITLLAKLYTDLYICFEETAAYFKHNKCTIVDYPVRFDTTHQVTQQDALQKIGFTSDKKTVLVVGGSQGSLFLNELMKTCIETTQLHLQIIHQIGINDKLNWQHFYESRAIKALVFDYNNEIHYLYQAADLIICRAGAGTLAEIVYFDKPCITIPLEIASTHHQVLNAQAIARKSKKILYVEQQLMGPALLAQHLINMQQK